MDARQRRMWVLPAPNGDIDKRDRTEIGIFYSLLYYAIRALSKPMRAIFTSCDPKPIIFMSKKGLNVFTSKRKTGQEA